MIHFLIIILALITLLMIQHFIFAKKEKNIFDYTNTMIQSERNYYQKEREKLLDRLMARNFEELKTEQVREKAEPMKDEPDDLVPIEEIGEHEWRNIEENKEAE